MSMKVCVLGARLGYNPSYIWCGIFASHVLVRGGQRWISGNGKSTAVWTYPWLRKEGIHMFQVKKWKGWKS